MKTMKTGILNIISIITAILFASHLVGQELEEPADPEVSEIELDEYGMPPEKQTEFQTAHFRSLVVFDNDRYGFEAPEYYVALNLSAWRQYPMVVTRVVDGDTIAAEIDLGLATKRDAMIRFIGIDAPEMKGETKSAGIASKGFLTMQFQSNYKVTLMVHPKITDSFGRILGVVFVGPVNINELMVNAGFAEIYEKKKKKKRDFSKEKPDPEPKPEE